MKKIKLSKEAIRLLIIEELEALFREAFSTTEAKKQEKTTK